MAVRVVYLGKLQDVAGRPESEFSSSSGDLDWPDLVEVLRNHVNEDVADAVCDPRNKIAVNGQIQSDRESLVFKHGDEVALLPPVSGG
ncbi:MoaD/ThiS family protein [Qipengyuania sp. 6B39]|uniref:MoaD/ThiS family protein n=1 Tax=Qipengyuania proteolytica TaxID=2867239 RepID=UPI001C89FEB1|nr:MoaD/ThiS family protein [Qipengyuania proteolytica]MBX7495605.1 MoaD/ThiS family protein [Qipengyuania proteolytica]